MCKTVVDERTVQKSVERSFPTNSSVARSILPQLLGVGMTLLVAQFAFGQASAQPGTPTKSDQPPAAPSAGQPPSSKVPPGKPSAPERFDTKPSQPSSLTSMGVEEMLAAALKDNPDIRVAEAKLREAERELSRVRMEVAQKVVVFRQDWEVQRARIEEYETRAKEAEKLFKAKAISLEDYRLAQVNVQVNRALLAKLEAELPYLLGRAPLGTSASRTQSPVARVYPLKYVRPQEVKDLLNALMYGQDRTASIGVDERKNTLIVSAEPDTLAALEAILRFADRSDRQLSGPRKPPRETERKVLEKLNEEVTIEFVETPLDDIVEFFRDWSKLNFHVRKFSPELNVTVHVEAVPFAAALQAIEDSTGHRISFWVRDYGLLVTRPEDAPPDGIRAVDLWTAASNTEKPKSEPE